MVPGQQLGAQITWINQLGSRHIREDRILDEAHASRGDTRRLSDLFALSIKAATRYTDTVDNPGLDTLSDRSYERSPPTSIRRSRRIPISTPKPIPTTPTAAQIQIAIDVR